MTIPSSVSSIGNSVFYGCTGLTSITIPEGVTSIGGSAFKGCTGLTSITIPESMTSIEESAFEGCTGLTSISIPKRVTRIGLRAFEGCTGLKSVNISSNIKNGGFYIFRGCTGLTTLEISEGVETLSLGMFADCTNLTSITLPSSLISIPAECFSGCVGITSIIIPKGLRSLASDSFYRCENLVSIQVDEGNDVFDSRDDCNAVIYTEGNKLVLACKTTNIPRNVKSIGSGAYQACHNLNSLVIFNSIEQLDVFAFSSVIIRNIRCESTMPIPLDYRHNGDYFNNKTLYHSPLYVPVGAWDAYAYADVWFQFHTIREEAMTTEQISSGNAYMMMDANSFTYLVYDPVNECVKSVEYKGGLDGTNPYNNWQVEEVKGKKYLYNLGAKKFAVPSMNGMAFSLVDEIESIEMIDGRNGIVLDGRDDASWSFVVNNEMSGNQNLKETITAITMISEDQQVSESFDLQGRKQQNVQNGLNIIRMKNGTAKKVLVK